MRSQILGIIKIIKFTQSHRSMYCLLQFTKMFTALLPTPYSGNGIALSCMYGLISVSIYTTLYQYCHLLEDCSLHLHDTWTFLLLSGCTSFDSHEKYSPLSYVMASFALFFLYFWWAVQKVASSFNV